MSAADVTSYAAQHLHSVSFVLTARSKKCQSNKFRLLTVRSSDLRQKIQNKKFQSQQSQTSTENVWQ